MLKTAFDYRRPSQTIEFDPEGMEFLHHVFFDPVRNFLIWLKALSRQPP